MSLLMDERKRLTQALITAGVLLGLPGGCGTSEPAPSQSPAATATATGPAGNATVGPLASAASSAASPGGVTVEAGWVRERPELTRLFTAANACARTELLMHAGGATLHSYILYSPQVAQAELDRRFQKSAGELGYTVAKTPDGPGFSDEAKGLSAYLGEARLTVLFQISEPLAKAATTPAAALGFATWPMLVGLPGATWESLELQQSDRGAHLQATLKLGAAGRGDVERWAQEHELARDADLWVQKWQPAPTPRAGISIEIDASGRLVVGETIGQEMSTPTCQGRPAPPMGVDPTTPPPAPASADELLKQMMGK